MSAFRGDGEGDLERQCERERKPESFDDEAPRLAELCAELHSTRYENPAIAQRHALRLKMKDVRWHIPSPLYPIICFSAQSGCENPPDFLDRMLISFLVPAGLINTQVGGTKKLTIERLPMAL